MGAYRWVWPVYRKRAFVDSPTRPLSFEPIFLLSILLASEVTRQNLARRVFFCEYFSAFDVLATSDIQEAEFIACVEML